MTSEYSTTLALIGVAQGVLRCIELLVLVPIIPIGIITLLTSIWKIRLLRNGLATIPALTSTSPGCVAGLCWGGRCLCPCGGVIKKSGSVPVGGWNVAHQIIRSPMTVSKLALTDETGAPQREFLYGSIPWRGSVVLYDPNRKNRYLHVNDLPFGLRPDPDTGAWKIRNGCSAVFGTVFAVVFWALWCGAVFGVVWYGMGQRGFVCKSIIPSFATGARGGKSVFNS